MDSLLNILPNLSIGVVSVVALAHLSLKHGETQAKSQEAFIKTLDGRAEKHEAAMQERETALRAVEKEVRTEVSVQLTASTASLKDTAKIMQENSRIMERVITHLDKH